MSHIYDRLNTLDPLLPPIPPLGLPILPSENVSLSDSPLSNVSSISIDNAVSSSGVESPEL